MRRLVIVGLVLGFTPLAAQSRDTTAMNGCARQAADARTILQLEEDWATALVRRDGAAFRRLLAEGFIYSENDRTIGRDDLIRDVVSGADTVRTAHNEEMRVHCFGETLVVVTGWLVTRGRGAAGPFDRRYRFTDTWGRSQGQWRVVAAHDYIAP